jgi:drug/metabolite transporter (DMT)-like permease
MFFFLAILATIGYALQSTLMAPVYRNLETLSASAYRGISLGISMLPLLLFASPGSINRAPGFVDYFIGAALFAALGNWCAANSFRYFPIGIAYALGSSAVVIFVAILDICFLKQNITSTALICTGIIIGSNILLAFQKNNNQIILKDNALAGFLYTLTYGLLLSLSIIFMSELSRKLDPFLASYFWELLIGLFSIGIGILRLAISGQPLIDIPAGEFSSILLRCSPTIIGTSCFAVAVTMGPVTIASAIGSGAIMACILFAYLFYREKISWRQGILMTVIVGAIVTLKVTS